MGRIAAIALIVVLVSASASAAFDRLPVPGGASGLRAATQFPSSVPDDMLLAEAARAWYGTAEAFADPRSPVRGVIEYFTSSHDRVADGPPLPLGIEAWARLLDCAHPCNVAARLVGNRSAMLMYYGLIAVDDETLRWLGAHPSLVRDLLREGAAAFAIAGPFLRIRNSRLVLPGGDAMGGAWASIVGERPSAVEPFIRGLMRRNDGRLAWLLSVLSQLDEAHLRFALAEGEHGLETMARYSVRSAPEWTIATRPFWRTPFDFSLVVALTDLTPAGVPRGSRAFWREVFRSDDLSKWRPSGDTGPLTAEALLDTLFEQPHLARERWEIFSLGQRTPGVERDAPEPGLVLRGARRHPALGVMLERIGVSSADLVLRVHRAAARISDRDSYGSRGELGAWQGALALVERSALTGGLDRAGVEAALSTLAALPFERPASELTAWLINGFLAQIAARPGAPADAEEAVLQVITGKLTPEGPRREATFTWEDLSYAFGAAASLVERMEEVRIAQGRASLEEVRLASRVASRADRTAAESLVSRLGETDIPADARDIARRMDRALSERDDPALKREARRAAESMVMAILPALAYAPHQAVTETPTLGADVSFRHQFVSQDDGPAAKRLRPWQLARGQATGGEGWNLQGSLLMLDLALGSWYTRRHTEPATAQPMFDEGDMIALAQVAALARSSGTPGLVVADVAAAIEKGRAVASGAGSVEALDDMLRQAGIDPWRRRAIRAQADSAGRAARILLYSEAWRLGGRPGLVCPHPAIDGGAHFGAAPHSTLLMEGRRSAGVVGAAAIDAQLRVAVYLESHHLPDQLFGDVAAGVLGDVIQGTHAARPDDFTAFGEGVRQMDDARMDEHLLALVADGTLARPQARVR